MPIIFIHGVNTRDTDPDYQTNVETRNDLLERRVLRPVSKTDARFREMQIVDAYWGGHGVQFHWGLQSLPPVSVLEHLGAEHDDTEADILFTESIYELSGAPPPKALEIEALGTEDLGETELLCRAAKTDRTAFLEHRRGAEHANGLQCDQMRRAPR
jgi:hypothetical protein